MAIKVSGTTVINDSRNIQNIPVADIADIYRSTSDGSDNGFVRINGGGGAANWARGAGASFFGNENATPGLAWLYSGNVTGSETRISAGGSLALSIDGDTGAWSVAGAGNTGTSGQVLTSQGSGAAPGWSTLSSDVVLITSGTFSSTSELQLTLTSATYKSYKLVLGGLNPSGDASLRMQISTDGGSTWISGASDYEASIHGYVDGTGVASFAAGAYLEITNDVYLTDATNGDLTAVYDIPFPHLTSQFVVQGHVTYRDIQNRLNRHILAGRSNADRAPNAIKIYFEGDVVRTISSGSYAFYGVK